MQDARVAPVEDNLDSFAEVFAAGSFMASSQYGDVAALFSDRAFPLLNPIMGARFEPGTVERRAREVVAAYLERGVPFLWWATPSGHADELRPVLLELGLTEHPVPGMYVELRDHIDAPVSDGTRLLPVGASAADDLMSVFLDGFGIPAEFADDFRDLVEAFFRLGGTHVLAYDEGRPVAGGSAWITGDTAGLYNICTLEGARGRGLGYAVTATLMNLARERGCTHAILHSSELGRPVYERLGFETVCSVPQFVWVPDPT